MRDVFVLGLFDTGLYVAHSLRGKGIRVTGFDYNLKNPGFHSRLLKPVKCYSPIDSPLLLLEQLHRFALAAKGKPVLIPSSELFLGFVSKYRDQLEAYFLFTMPEVSIMDSILNKYKQFVLAESMGFNVPAYALIANHSDAISFTNVKSSSSRFIVKAYEQEKWKHYIKEKAFIAENVEQARYYMKMLADKDIKCVVQELIPGACTENYEYNALIMKGEIISSVVIRKIRQYPAGFGAATCIETSNNKMVAELGKKFVLNAGVEGFSNTEFKLDPRNGKYMFIETNARIWQQVRLTEAQGQDFLMEYLSRMLEFEYHPMYKGNNRKVRWDDLIADVLPIYWDVKRSPIELMKIVKGLFRTRSFGLVNIHDPAPMLYSMGVLRK